LIVADPKALQYILHTSGYNFPKSPDASHIIRMLTGDGVGSTKGKSSQQHLVSPTFDKPLEGEIHRRQRKVMAGAFSVPHLKAFLTQFQVTASKARGPFVKSCDRAS
jgi:cytochrome P450